MDKKHLMIIGGVLVISTAGFLIYKSKKNKDSLVRINGNMAINAGTSYFFSNDMKYALSAEQASMFGFKGTASLNKLLVNITDEEFSLFKDGGAFKWVGFPFEKCPIYSNLDSSGNVYYFVNGKKRWVTDGPTWSLILSDSTRNLIGGELNLPLDVFNSLPMGEDINSLVDLKK